MAKTAQAKSALTVAYEAAKERHNTASEHAAKAGAKDADKAKAASAEKEMKNAEEAMKADNFTRIGVPRVRKVRAGIRSLKKLLNIRGYSFTQEQADKLVGGVKEAVKELEATAAVALSGKKDAVASDDFAL